MEFDDVNVWLINERCFPLKVFRGAHNLSFTLLSDVNGTIARLFGVPVSKGGVFKAVLEGKEVTLKRSYTFARWTFVLGKDGRVLYKDSNAEPSNDTTQAMEFIRGLK